VNEGKGQRESYNGTPFPPGLGVFFPAAGQSGNISPGGGGSTHYNTFNIQGNDPDVIARVVVQKLEGLMS